MTLRLRSISPLGLLALAACQSGEDTTATSSGLAVKGPLSGALAFVDANGNLVFDAGETSGLTDVNGRFSLENPTGAQIVIQAIEGTVDGSTGAAIRGVTMFGGANATLITPITTLGESGVDLKAFATAIGLDGVDLLAFNPYATGVDPAQALIAEKAAQQVVATLQVISGALVQNGGATDLNVGYMAAFEALATSVKAQMATNDGKIEFNSSLLVSVIDAAGLGNSGTLSTALATQIIGIVGAIENVTELGGESAIAAFTAGGSLASVYADINTDGTDIDVTAVLTNLAPTAIALNHVGATLSVDEVVTPTHPAIAIATIAVTDDTTADGNFTLVLSGADAAKFVIVGQQIFLAANATLSAEDIAKLDVEITATDELGKSFTQAFSITVNNVDEATTGSVSITGAATVGGTLTLADTLSDVDNGITGHTAGDFATKAIQWFANGVAVQNATSGSLQVTEALAGKAITATVTTVDQQGGAPVVSSAVFGSIAPAFAPITVVFHQGFLAAIEEIKEGLTMLEGGVESFMASISDKMTPFTNGFDVDPVISVTSSGILATFGAYSVSGTFANFSPTTLDALLAAVDNFDQNDLSTLTISGGFRELSLNGPNGALVKLELTEGNSGPDVLRIIDVGAASGDVNSISLIGQFDGQISTLTDVIHQLGSPEQLPEPDFYAYFNEGSFDSAGYEAAWVTYNTQYDQANRESLQYLAEHEQLQGFGVQLAGENNEQYLELDWGSAGTDGSPDAVSIKVGDYTLSFNGDFPDSLAQLQSLLDDTGPLAGFWNGDGNYSEAELQSFIDGAASADFNDFNGITLTHSVTANGATTITPLLDVVIDDFADLIAHINAIDGDGASADNDVRGSYTPTAGGPVQMASDTVSFIQDDDGLYLILGDGVDLDSIFGPDESVGSTLAA